MPPLFRECRSGPLVCCSGCHTESPIGEQVCSAPARDKGMLHYSRQQRWAHKHHELRGPHPRASYSHPVEQSGSIVLPCTNHGTGRKTIPSGSSRSFAAANLPSSSDFPWYPSTFLLALLPESPEAGGSNDSAADTARRDCAPERK